jgi:hypothetical protein
MKKVKGKQHDSDSKSDRMSKPHNVPVDLECFEAINVQYTNERMRLACIALRKRLDQSNMSSKTAKAQ